MGRPNLNKDFLERPGQPEGLRVPGGENVVKGVVRGLFFGGAKISSFSDNYDIVLLHVVTNSICV